MSRYRVFASFLCVLSSKLVLGSFIHLHLNWTIPEKIINRRVEDMEFPGLLKKKHADFLGVN